MGKGNHAGINDKRIRPGDDPLQSAVGRMWYSVDLSARLDAVLESDRREQPADLP